ncbi:MAG: methyltransferase domain-containing protein [Betaproteobacteria bacterium]|nr:methyltransferase domain-containing protein [Betaproteobacteria bacterium]
MASNHTRMNHLAARVVRRALASLLLAAGIFIGTVAPGHAQDRQSSSPADRKPEARDNDNVAGPYVPTPWVIVAEMLKLGDITAGDVVYDLGSGDGRLVITAAKRFGARGVGVELQSTLVEMAEIGARHEKVADKVKFIQGDLFQADFSEASVVTLYLLPRFVTRLVPKLRAELKAGSRIVSHDYPLAPWPPDKTLIFDVEEKEQISGSVRTTLYYYVVPAKIGGTWQLTLPKELAGGPLSMEVVQEPDRLSGVARAGRDVLPLRDPLVRADKIRFGLLHRGRLLSLSGVVSGSGMSGEVVAGGVRDRWSARLQRPGPL